MKKLVRYEFRKILNQVTILSVVSLVILSTVLNLMLYFSSSNSTITSEGKMITGVASFRTLKNEAKDLEGFIDQKYLDKLVKEFNSSIEKRDFEDRFGMSYFKYTIPNYLINFAHYSSKVNNFTMGLDFDFIKSEKDFYNQYKKSVSNLIKNNNEQNWFKYNDKQMSLINKKIDKIETPLKVQYSEGLANLIYKFGDQYWLVLVVIAFSLSGLFSKDSNNGIDELTLSSTFGRKKNMDAKIIAGNIFSVVVYMIFVITHFIQHGLMGSLHGWTQSAQNHWYSCIYNISFGTGILIMIFMGLLGVLIIANLVMMISIKFKYAKLSTLVSLGSIWWIIKLTYTANSIKLQLNPIYFVKRLAISNISDFDIYYFIGDIIIPYSLIAVALACVYILVIRLLTLMSYKKYNLN